MSMLDGSPSAAVNISPSGKSFPRTTWDNFWFAEASTGFVPNGMPLALTVTKLGGDEMDNSSFQDQLRQIESEVAAGERRQARLAIVREKKRQRLDTDKEEADLQAMRESQNLRQQERQHILTQL
jgi:hypothetical protein